MGGAILRIVSASSGAIQNCFHDCAFCTLHVSYGSVMRGLNLLCGFARGEAGKYVGMLAGPFRC